MKLELMQKALYEYARERGLVASDETDAPADVEQEN